jgi:isoleucyl-tRNA synthetase
LAGVTTDRRAPYKAVLTHGFVVDGQGKKMSKSAGNVVAPQDVIKQSGAEILRLWVAAQDYKDDLRISPTILSQQVEVYRKVRNTCRFILSNLHDFDPALHRVSFNQLPELDRWALLKLHKLVDVVKKSYERFDFRQIIHELDYFCTVNMSAIYLDILKDRLYTFHKDSQVRRSSQTVLCDVLVAFAKLMAPILSFTADEIWRMLPEGVRKEAGTTSVHLATFPADYPAWADAQLAERWERLLRVRESVQGALELSRSNKTIGSSLEARVSVRCVPGLYVFLKAYEKELPSLFIVSQVSLREDSQLSSDKELLIEISLAMGKKCERCWNYREAVGKDADHPTLCDRCLEAIR